MPENVVYIVGAGFSAPLGLPVMRTFLDCAKDLLIGGAPETHRSVHDVLVLLRQLAPVQRLFASDLDNIEEVLSILEVSELMDGATNRTLFQNFLAHVVSAYTPALPTAAEVAQIASSSGTARYWEGLAMFTTALRRFHYDGPEPKLTVSEDAPRYSVISLNYDGVLEHASAHSDRKAGGMPPLEVVTVGRPLPQGGLRLLKLHGSAHDSSIVSPTWNKTQGTGVLPAWTEAVECLKTAHCIRVLGYSLPATDLYMRYLLTYAGTVNDHLKEFDVLCWDPDGSVKRAYASFVSSRRLRFVHTRLEPYIENLRNTTGYYGDLNLPTRNALEEHHDRFVASALREQSER